MEGLQEIAKRILPGGLSCDLAPEEASRVLAQIKADTFNASRGDLNEKGPLGGMNCPKCLNRGFIMAAVEVNSCQYETRVRECGCMVVRRNVRRLERSGLKDVTRMYTFKKYQADEAWQEKIKLAAMDYVTDVKNGENGWFFIGGQSGCGKTHICTAIAVQLLKNQMDLRYMVWRDEARKLKAVANSPEYTAMLDEFKQVKVLYIDDFLKAGRDSFGSMKPTEADVALAFELLNYRNNNRDLLTIISSELTLEEIADIDEAIAGRIAQNAERHRLVIARKPGRNYRLKGVVEL